MSSHIILCLSAEVAVTNVAQWCHHLICIIYNMRLIVMDGVAEEKQHGSHTVAWFSASKRTAEECYAVLSVGNVWVRWSPKSLVNPRKDARRS